MSDANLQVGIESGQAVSGSRIVVRSINDIYNAANAADTKLRSMESTLGSVGSNSGLTQAKAAAQSLQSPLQSIKAELEKIESRIVRIGVTAIALGVVNTIFGKIKETLSGAIKAVDDFQISVISIAASLTQIRVANGETDLAGAYQKSSIYAGQLALKLQEVDKNSFANYKGLMAMLQVMTAQGQVLDINNKKQVDAFTNLSNAIAIMTPGQDQQMQMYQETRAIMSGVADRHSQVARMLDQQIKAQGKYKGGLKEVAALGRQQGNTMELIAEYLQGIGAASGDIAQTWSTVVATFETALNFVQRMAFGPIVKDLTQMVSLFSDLMKSNTGGISDAVQGAWGYIKEAVFVIDEKTKKLKFSEDFLTTLKIAADITKAIIDSFAILIKWTIKYSDEIKNTITLYVAWKVQATVMNALMMATTTSLNTNTTAQIANTQSVMMAFEKESLRLASQKATATFLAEQAKVMALITVEELNRAAALTEGLLAEQAANAEKVKTLGILRQEAASNVAVLEGKVAIAVANKQAKVDAIELLTIQKTQLVQQIANGNNSKIVANQLTIAETELAAMRRSSSALSGVVTRTENQLTAARIALTNATMTHTAAVNVAAKTGFQLHIAKEAEIAARVANKVALEAETLALERQTAATSAAAVGSRVLAGAKGLLGGAISALGGPLGVIITLLTVGATAWWLWGKNAKEATGANYADSIESMTEKIRKQNKELAERDRIAKEGGSTDAELELLKKEEAKLANLTNKINELGGPTTLKAGQSFSTLTVKVKDTNTALITMQMQAENTKGKILALKAAIDERDKNTPKASEWDRTNKLQGGEKGKKTESEKASDKLKEGFKAFQLESVKMGRVEDELGSKIEARHLQMTNLFEEAKLANGSEDEAMREKIKQFVKLADLQQTEAANKKDLKDIDRAYQEQSLSDYKNNMAAKKVELHDNLEDGKISYTEYYQSIRNMVEELGNKEIAVLQDSYNIKKSEMDKRAELYWNDQLSYSEYLKSVKELIEAETKLKNLKAGVAATVASANKDITKGQKEEAKLTADIEDKVLNLTKQWVAAAKAKNAYYKTTPEYKKLSAESKKRADAMGELDEFSAGQQERQAGYTVAENKMSAIGGDNYGSKYFKIATQYEEETALIKEQYKLRLIDQETYTAQMEQSQSKHQSQMTGMVFDAATEMTGVLRQAAGDSVELQMAAMLIEKSIAIARILVNTEVAASAALAIPIVGIGQAQVIRALGYASAAMVATPAVVEGINIAGQREFGGPVSAGKAYIVGEKRPEVFVPDQNGTILPSVPTNGQADNSTFVVNQTVQIDARGADAGVEARIDAAMKRAKAETEASIMNSMNRGGKFAVASGRR